MQDILRSTSFQAKIQISGDLLSEPLEAFFTTSRTSVGGEEPLSSTTELTIHRQEAL
jgi:hypothetical protein